MKIGVPQGLLYSKYHTFAKTFLEELGAEVIISPNTNKSILDEGVRCCVDEACLPMKVFHGHVAWLKDRCDSILVPRFMGIREHESVCPMFCGLIEMISNDIPELPDLIDTPVYSVADRPLAAWAQIAGSKITSNKTKIAAAFKTALEQQRCSMEWFNDCDYPITVGLLGHVNNVYDSFINMNIKRKLNSFGIGVMTSECIDKSDIDAEADALFKKPFWSLAREYYGSAVSICNNGMADGIIYLSSFSCGIDSVVTELIRCETDDFPFMILKLDEHTGEAGLDTRIEAFADMLKRRNQNGIDLS